MNPRNRGGDFDYRAMEPPWAYDNYNIIMRCWQIGNAISKLETGVKKLREFSQRYREGDVNPEIARESLYSYSRIMESIDTLRYNFPDLGTRRWFSTFKSDVAHGYWRVEAGRFSSLTTNKPDEEELDRFFGEVRRVVQNSPDSNRGAVRQIHDFFETYGEELNYYDAPENFQDEIYEARDLYCIGYYSTGLIVLGRAIERALLELGHARNVESVQAYGEEREWRSTNFRTKVEALKHVDMPERHGKVFSRRQYSQASILVDYRNQVAHSDYRNIDKEKALRQMRDAYDLLIEITDMIEYLEGLDEELVPTVQGQKAQ